MPGNMHDRGANPWWLPLFSLIVVLLVFGLLVTLVLVSRDRDLYAAAAAVTTV